jgi:hypothetical protein
LTTTKLQSGAELKVSPAPFAEARALYQAVLEEVRGLKIDAETEIDVNLKKDLFCVLLASKKIELALWECMKRCTYNGQKITPDTFEDVKAREDYFDVCVAVGQENVLPFTKSLYAAFSSTIEKVKSSLA